MEAGTRFRWERDALAATLIEGAVGYPWSQIRSRAFELALFACNDIEMCLVSLSAMVGSLAALCLARLVSVAGGLV